MRTYDQLTEDERQQAQDECLRQLLQEIVEHGIRFNDEANDDDLQARIDTANDEAEQMQTPWFASEYIMDAAGDELRSMAGADAQDALYPEPDERIVHLPVEEDFRVFTCDQDPPR